MNEFSLIHTYFSPLAHDLTNDAAVLAVPVGYELIVTTDALMAGVHFFGNEDPALIARKALRANLSDLAAMGAAPLSYQLALLLPRNTQQEWISRFAEGLAEDQAAYGIALSGGDTTATPGPLGVSITALGLAPQGQALTRAGARPGDGVYVSGTIGDSTLGLRAYSAQGSAASECIPTSFQDLGLTAQGAARSAGVWGSIPQFFVCEEYITSCAPYLIQRYLLPLPRLSLGERLRGIASSCMDISDGLAQDIGHICKASGYGARIEAARVPLSAQARRILAAEEETLETILTGGDDYELLFTAPCAQRETLEALSRQLDLPLTLIGTITREQGVIIADAQGKPLALKNPGYRHF